MILLIGTLIFVLLWFVYGWRKGLVNATLRLIFFIGTWYIAIKFSKPLSGAIANIVNGDFFRTTIPQAVAGDGSNFLASGIVFVLILAIGGTVSTMILRQFKIIRRIPLLGSLDAILGAVVCGLIGITIAFFILQLLSVIPNSWLQDQFMNTPELDYILDKLPFFAQQIYNWWL